ncbi:ATP-binding protein [Serratia sp. OS31]|uniref:ATP-binding protein n=1 Tax=Serratia sp. OS31 TaxID=2760844 RepID=UPI001601C677|nr:ATP-binding protein [Serratia sp. OS31]MBB1582555.1 ATP-binding protein [Serratia sp. OS31]
MTLRLEQLQFGSVREVDGSNIVLKADDLDKKLEDKNYQLEVGSYVNCGGRHGDTICIVSKIQIEDVEVKIKDGDSVQIQSSDLNKVTLSVVGSVDDFNKFTRGASRLPTINCKSYILTPDQVNKLLGIDSEVTNKNFLVTDNDLNKVYLDIDKLLGRHVAILGTTGSGKSCTVASIMQSILNSYKHPRIIFFDIHNEYPSAFGYGDVPNEGYKEKTQCTAWSEFSLPYWFLDIEEFLDIYYPGAGTTQFAEVKSIITTLKQREYSEISTESERVSVDTPIFFDINDLIKEFKEKRDKASSAAKAEPWEKLILKFENIIDDSRYSFLHCDISNKTNLSNYFNKVLGLNGISKYLNILDLSGLPSEVRNICIGILTRLCFDYKYWDLDPENLPLALVLEEAHNYIPEEESARFSLCKRRVERVAKEGRKYGISLIVVTQRPSNISTTVLSQCGTFITLRLTNDIDQNKVRRLLPDTLGGQADVLPSLRDGEALVSGDGIKLPRKVMFRSPAPMPKSNDVRYHHSWTTGQPDGYSVEAIIRGWERREK